MIDDLLSRNPLDVLLDVGVHHLGQRLGIPLQRPRPQPEIIEGEVLDNPTRPLRKTHKRVPLPAGEGDLGELLRRAARQPAGVYVILGPRGSGKTGFVLRFTEMLGRPRYSLGPIGGGLDREYSPVTRDVVEISAADLARVPPRSVVLLDDASLIRAANSRDYTSSAAMELQDDINACRHRGITFAATGQQTASLNKYLAGEPDASFWKPPRATSRAVGYMAERPGVERTLEQVGAAFAEVPRTAWPHVIYVISDEYSGLMDYDYPRGM